VATRLGDPHLIHDAQTSLVTDLLEQGDLPGVDATLAAHRRLAASARQPYLEWYAEHYRVMRALLDGDLSLAETTLFTAFEQGRRWNPELALQWFGVQIYGLRRAQGRLAELRPELAVWVDQSRVSSWRAAQAFAELQGGERDAAREALASLVGSGIGIPRDYSWLAGLGLLAELCAGLGARKEAEQVHRALLPHAGVQVVAGIGMLHLGPVTRFLGLTGA